MSSAAWASNTQPQIPLQVRSVSALNGVENYGGILLTTSLEPTSKFHMVAIQGPSKNAAIFTCQGDGPSQCDSAPTLGAAGPYPRWVKMVVSDGVVTMSYASNSGGRPVGWTVLGTMASFS
eukprot:RCo000021